MAQIRKRGNSYQIVVDNGKDMNGKRIQETMTFRPDPSLIPKQRDKAANRAAAEFEEKVKNGVCIDGDKITFAQFYEKWYSEYAVIELEKTTLAGYDHNIRTNVFPSLGQMKLSTIKAVHLNSLYNSLRKDGVRQDGKSGGYSDTTINMIHVTISSILKKAVEWEVIMSNPCDRVKTPRRAKDSDDIEYFTPEQAKVFLDALGMEYDQPVKARKRKDRNGDEYKVAAYVNKVSVPLQFKVLFHIAVCGGLRRGEIVSLKWSDIDFENNTINISKSTAYVERETFIKGTKTKLSNRKITMSPVVMKLLKEYRGEYLKMQMKLGSKWAVDEDGSRLDFLFIQRDGKQMSLSTPLKRFHSIINQYNATVQKEEDKLPLIHFHGLRHTCATLLISQGVDVRTVAGRLGHSQTSTTLDIYSHPLRKKDEEASEKLDEVLFDRVQA